MLWLGLYNEVNDSILFIKEGRVTHTSKIEKIEQKEKVSESKKIFQLLFF